MEREIERQRTETARPRPEEGAERGELLGALRELLSHLPDVERKLLALYYGAGMSQEEIGAALDMPQRTVSFKLQACLERLRKNLAQAGMAAAAPLLTPQLLGSVFASGPEAAPGLAAKTLARCDMPYALRESGARSARAAAKGGSGAGLAVAAVLVVGAAAGGYVLMQEKPAAEEGAPEPAASVPSPAPAAKIEPEPVVLPPQNWTYDFNQPPGEGFEHVLGPMRWGRVAKARANCIIVDSMTDNSGFLLPLRKPRTPLLVKVRYWILEVGHCRLAIGWTDGKECYPVRTRKNSVRKFDGMKAMETAYYFMDGYAIEYHADEFSEFFLEAVPHLNERMYVFGRNIGIERIEVQELRADEVPAAVRDRDALVKRLGGTYTDMPGYPWGTGYSRPLAEFLKANAVE